MLQNKQKVTFGLPPVPKKNNHCQNTNLIVKLTVLEDYVPSLMTAVGGYFI